MLTVCARRERSTDPVLKKYAPDQVERDVVVYRDAVATDHFATIRWDKAAKPDRRNRYITLNCYRWRLEWLLDAA